MIFDVVMITVDRAPKRNFLSDTVANLKRAGVFGSPLLHSFSIVDSGSESLQFVYDAFDEVDRGIYLSTDQRSPTQNASFALKLGARLGGPWVLFLEDDIDVCADFLDSVAGWLNLHSKGFHVFPLGANYAILNDLVQQGKTGWLYPVQEFYGTLAVAMRRDDALSVAEHLDKNADNHSYDLLMSEWAREKGISHFLTPVPSFIQHIGTESIIRPGSLFHEYGSWPGRDWSYQVKTSEKVNA